MDINSDISPSHLECFAPDRSNFQFIHLGRSFTEAPNRTTSHCDPPYSSSCLQNATPLHSQNSALPSPMVYNLWLLLWRERTSFFFPRVVFEFYDTLLQMDNERSWISRLSTITAQFSSDVRINEDFWRKVLQMAWNAVSP
ncbi:hypothetical protein AVEN_142589-1 [Araneus ventricosus]|uniref:Uncharacterized protein n=1 Tax=Araneus ventricosus TaxID=182803 RepID=A0A4Y2CG73_ARAVE|nr:hypothetical protein AVEN_142589-1 [Araneus ventricosus]